MRGYLRRCFFNRTAKGAGPFRCLFQQRILTQTNTGLSA